MVGTVRVGVLGLGQITRFMHAPVIAHPTLSGRFEIAVVYDPLPKALRNFRRSWKGDTLPQVVNSAEEVVASPSIDAILVAAPTSRHAELVRLAIAAGKPVLLEKPAARSATQVRELAASAAARGVAVEVGMVLRHSRTVAAVERLVASGELGRLLWMQWDEHRPFAPSTWRYQRDEEGDAILLEKAVHQVDLFCHVARSPVAAVTASGAQLMLPRPGCPTRPLRSFNYTVPLGGVGFDDVMLICEHGNGVRSLLHVSYVSPWGRESRWLLQLEKGKIVVYWEQPLAGGRRATLTYVLADDQNLAVPWRMPMAYPPSAERLHLEEPCIEPLHNGSILQWERFHEVVTAGREPTCSLDEAAHTLDVVEAAMVSIEEGRKVQVAAPPSRS